MEVGANRTDLGRGESKRDQKREKNRGWEGTEAPCFGSGSGESLL